MQYNSVVHRYLHHGKINDKMIQYILETNIAAHVYCLFR